jgi:hypothetical protein
VGKKSNFGENLRREREMRGVELEEISNATRISTRFLQALENERWDQLPGGVFNRGFIRTVARYLGLDEEALVSEYSLATNDPPEIAVWVDTPARRPRNHLKWLVPVLLVVMLAGGVFAWRESRVFVTSLVSGWLNDGPRAAVVKRPATAQAPQGAQTPAPQAAAEQVLQLTIQSSKATSLTVVADGKTVFDGRINPSDRQRFEAKQQFDVRAGNANALVMELNGELMPPLAGLPGQAGSMTLTHQDLKKPQS